MNVTWQAQRLINNSPAVRQVFRTVPLPRFLDSVISIDENSEVASDGTGLGRKARGRIWRALCDLYATGYYPALTICLRHRGEILINRAIGHAAGNHSGAKRGEEKVLATPDTPICLYSASKAITAALIHKLAEQGELNLLDPISHYIPEFGQNGKERTTIYQLLSHRAGIPGIPPGQPFDTVYDHATSLQLLCAAKPIDEYGRVQAYHAVTGGVILQELLARVTGADIKQYWRKHFKEPMGFEVFDYGGDAKTMERMAQDSVTGMKVLWPLSRVVEGVLGANLDDAMAVVNDPRFFAQPISAANMVATAEEVSRFYQMLLEDGNYQGKQLLDPLTVHRLTWETGPHRFDGMLKLPLRYTPGMMLGGKPLGLFGWNAGNAFGHPGLVNTLTWADPDRDIAVALLTTGKPVMAGNLPALFKLLLAITNNIPSKKH
jgi:CubicO group peptidase (beta-lactamase class C family)